MARRSPGFQCTPTPGLHGCHAGTGSHPHFRARKLSVGPRPSQLEPCSPSRGGGGPEREEAAQGPWLPSLEGAHGGQDGPQTSPLLAIHHGAVTQERAQTRPLREGGSSSLRVPASASASTHLLCEHGARAAPVPPSQPGPVTLLSSRTWAPRTTVPASPRSPGSSCLPAAWWWGGAQRSRLCSPSLESRQPVQ